MSAFSPPWPLRPFLIAVVSAAMVACSGSDEPPANGPDTTVSAPGAMTASAGTAASFAILDVNSPIAGVKVDMPADALSNGTVVLDIQYQDAAPAPLRAEALAEGALIISKTIVLTKNRAGTFNTAVAVTVPYDKTKLSTGDVPSVLFWDETANEYQAMAVVAHDATAGTVTFKTAHFSRFVVAVVPGLGGRMAAQATADATTKATLDADSGFRPSADGFFPSNSGSYSSPGGNCLGMAAYADWFFERAKATLNKGTGLFNTYLEGVKASPDDDVVAEELIVRAHAAASDEWERRLKQNPTLLTEHAAIATSLAQAIKLTGKPQLFLMFGNPTWLQSWLPGVAAWGHAVVVYRYSATDGIFYFYDSNARNDNTAGIRYVPGTGFTSLTKTGMYTPEPNQYAFDAVGSIYSPTDMRALFDGAAAGWNNGAYGSFSFSNLTVDATTRVALVADRKAVRLTGTVTPQGGTAAAAPNTVDVYISGKRQGSYPLAQNAFDINLPALPDTGSSTEVLLVARCDNCEINGRTSSLYGTFTRVKLKSQSALENLGFENGNFDLWTSVRSLWGGGGVVNPSDKSTIVTPGFDPIATTLPMVAHGKFAARVNNEDNDYHISTVTRDIVVPTSASSFALNFKWAAVLEDPQHDPKDQPYVDIQVTNLQTSAVLYQRRYYANDPSFSGWQPFQGGQWKAIDWQAVPLTGLERFAGHTLRITVVAADCALGGHGGYAYLDAQE